METETTVATITVDIGRICIDVIEFEDMALGVIAYTLTHHSLHFHSDRVTDHIESRWCFFTESDGHIVEVDNHVIISLFSNLKVLVSLIFEECNPCGATAIDHNLVGILSISISFCSPTGGFLMEIKQASEMHAIEGEYVTVLRTFHTIATPLDAFTFTHQVKIGRHSPIRICQRETNLVGRCIILDGITAICVTIAVIHIRGLDNTLHPFIERKSFIIGIVDIRVAVPYLNIEFGIVVIKEVHVGELSNGVAIIELNFGNITIALIHHLDPPAVAIHNGINRRSTGNICDHLGVEVDRDVVCSGIEFEAVCAFIESISGGVQQTCAILAAVILATIHAVLGTKAELFGGAIKCDT